MVGLGNAGSVGGLWHTSPYLGCCRSLGYCLHDWGSVLLTYLYLNSYDWWWWNPEYLFPSTVAPLQWPALSQHLVSVCNWRSCEFRFSWAICGSEATILAGAAHWGFTHIHEVGGVSVGCQLAWAPAEAVECWVGVSTSPKVICSWVSFTLLSLSEMRRRGFW